MGGVRCPHSIDKGQEDYGSGVEEANESEMVREQSEERQMRKGAPEGEVSNI